MRIFRRPEPRPAAPGPVPPRNRAVQPASPAGDMPPRPQQRRPAGPERPSSWWAMSGPVDPACDPCGAPPVAFRESGGPAWTR